MEIRQVELTPQQLAENAVERAKKALDASKVGEALNEYNTALRYQPGNEVVRQKLAALYYGKRETRRAVEVLQQGIKRNKASQSLRLALAKLLIKEQQPQAALSPLVYLPEQPQIRYLAMRAALAQQNKMTDTALETYQLLVQREADNARWWLGLAIQQERQQSYAAAKASYQKALQRVGVSGKTQAFIRDRLSLLETLEETAHAD
jgi:MSHA biogenesis protein MshN